MKNNGHSNGSTAASNEDAIYLRNLGERVRRARMDKNITRKALANSSGVSERYLAQLESGEANVSVLLLREIARALELSAASLLSEQLPAGHRIALIGLRGAGKSTVGKLLADQLHAPFIELDREIEHASGLSIGMILDMYGQEGFRRLERQSLERVLKAQADFVLATSGGLVQDAETYNRLRETCRTVWLRTSPEEHMQRVIGQGDMRPMGNNAQAMDALKRILAEREPLYAQADTTQNTSGRTPETIAAEIARQVVSQKPGIHF
jgi:XRE family aerobic/anaerobic benzoate catabolism transcriptional regulator